MLNKRLLDRARAVFLAESVAISDLAPRVGPTFITAVEMLVQCKGRVITTGIGKAGIIAHKVAATLSSTGTPALFLHPSEAVHGDLGMVSESDIVLAFSNSGESDELSRMLPSLKYIGAPIVAIVGSLDSTLSRAATIALDINVAAEACPLGLAPTASTAAMLAMGDALAMCAMESRGFTREDYAIYHPAGALGRKLTLRVSDIMRSGEQLALVNEVATLQFAMFQITKAGAGCAFVLTDSGNLAGIVTDGDVRRAIQFDRDSLDRPASEVMIHNPFVIVGNPLAAEALQMMEESPKKIGEAPVVDADGQPVGMLMLKDLLRSGLV